MNLWRTTRTEVAGAWRSLRYDMSRRQPGAEPDGAGPGGPAQPDVTSTGMHTFGGPVEELRTGYEEFGRPPRRMVAVSVFALLTVAGAAGSYFAVVNGLGALLREKPPAPQAYPMAAAAPPDGTGATTGIGRGGPPAKARAAGGRPAGAATTTATSAAPVPAGTTTAAAGPPAPRRTTPERGTHPTRTSCGCVRPPVPTPTAPSTSPSATPSPSVTPSHSDDPSASPSPSTSGSGDPAHRKRRPRGY
jgi:hypothetical protein